MATPVSLCPLKRVEVHDGSTRKSFDANSQGSPLMFSIEAQQLGEDTTPSLILLIHAGFQRLLSVRLSDLLKPTSNSDDIVSSDGPELRLCIRIPSQGQTLVVLFAEARDHTMSVCVLQKSGFKIRGNATFAPTVRLRDQEVLPSSGASLSRPRLSSITPIPNFEQPSQAPSLLSTQSSCSTDNSLGNAAWPSFDHGGLSMSQPQLPSHNPHSPFYQDFPLQHTISPFACVPNLTPPSALNTFGASTTNSGPYKPRVGSPLRYAVQPAEPARSWSNPVTISPYQFPVSTYSQGPQSQEPPGRHEIHTGFNPSLSSTSLPLLHSNISDLGTGSFGTVEPLPGAESAEERGTFRDFLPAPRRLPFNTFGTKEHAVAIPPKPTTDKKRKVLPGDEILDTKSKKKRSASSKSPPKSSVNHSTSVDNKAKTPARKLSKRLRTQPAKSLTKDQTVKPLTSGSSLDAGKLQQRKAVHQVRETSSIAVASAEDSKSTALKKISSKTRKAVHRPTRSLERQDLDSGFKAETKRTGSSAAGTEELAETSVEDGNAAIKVARGKRLRRTTLKATDSADHARRRPEVPNAPRRQSKKSEVKNAEQRSPVAVQHRLRSPTSEEHQKKAAQSPSGRKTKTKVTPAGRRKKSAIETRARKSLPAKEEQPVGKDTETRSRRKASERKQTLSQPPATQPSTAHLTFSLSQAPNIEGDRQGHTAKLICLNCRKAHRKCSKDHPICTGCYNNGLECVYSLTPPPPSRRPEHRALAAGRQGEKITTRPMTASSGTKDKRDRIDKTLSSRALISATPPPSPNQFPKADRISANVLVARDILPVIFDNITQKELEELTEPVFQKYEVDIERGYDGETIASFYLEWLHSVRKDFWGNILQDTRSLPGGVISV